MLHAVATKKSAVEELALPSVTAIATRMLDGHMLRAIARDWPGGAPDLFLERIDYGDEADPHVVVRQTKIAYRGSAITSMRFEADGLHFESEDQRWFVRASSDAFAEKAIRDE
jgi:hypothetical protein